MANKLYGPVNGEARLINDLYGGHNSEVKMINKLYGPSNSQAKLIHQGFGHLYYRILLSMAYTLSHKNQSTNFQLIVAVDDQKFIKKYNNWTQENGLQKKNISNFSAGYIRNSTSAPWGYYISIAMTGGVKSISHSSRSDFVQELDDWGITPGGSWYGESSSELSNYSQMHITPIYDK